MWLVASLLAGTVLVPACYYMLVHRRPIALSHGHCPLAASAHEGEAAEASSQQPPPGGLWTLKADLGKKLRLG